MAKQDEKPAEIVPEPEAETEKSPEPESNPELDNKESATSEKSKKAGASSRWQRWRGWYLEHKKWTIPATVLVVLLILTAIPITRYAIAGTVIKKDVSLRVVDSTAHTPVSEAKVTIGNTSGLTDGEGRVTLKSVKAGQYTAAITKQYYKDQRIKLTVPIIKSQASAEVNFEATGRQVKVVIANTISKENLKGVEIVAGDVKATTDDKGAATIVLPAGTDKRQAKLKLDGYNEATVDIEISQTSIKDNKFTLTPAGKIYFLSNRTGKLDIMAVNLDGSDAKVVVAGTGNEQSSSTFFMPSPDGKYAALVAKRTASEQTPQLYVLKDDKLVSADTGNARFTLIGWTGSRIVYEVDRNDIAKSQAGKEKIKSYDATSGQLITLDQNQSYPNADAWQYYGNKAISGDSLVFVKQWGKSYYYTNIDDKPHTVSSIKTDGTNYKTIATYDPKSYIEIVRKSPVTFNIWQRLTDGSDIFYEFSAASSPKEIKINTDQFYENTYSYFFSPSAKQAMWVENRDGKSTFLLGDATGKNPKEVASLSEYQAEGWYSDNYLLLSKKNSELYIISTKGGTPLKVTDYQSTQGFYY